MRQHDQITQAVLNKLRPRKPKTVATLKALVGGVTTNEVEKALELLESTGFARSVLYGFHGDLVEAWCCTQSYWIRERGKI